MRSVRLCGLPVLWMAHGCFVISRADRVEHDRVFGVWEGVWESEESDEHGDLEVELDREGWEGRVEFAGGWLDSELDGELHDSVISMRIYGDEPFAFEMTLEATLDYLERMDGDCELELEFDPGTVFCTFSLKRQ